jgi:hypothetical protein
MEWILSLLQAIESSYSIENYKLGEELIVGRLDLFWGIWAYEPNLDIGKEEIKKLGDNQLFFLKLSQGKYSLELNPGYSPYMNVKEIQVEGIVGFLRFDNMEGDGETYNYSIRFDPVEKKVYLEKDLSPLEFWIISSSYE